MAGGGGGVIVMYKHGKAITAGSGALGLWVVLCLCLVLEFRWHLNVSNMQFVPKCQNKKLKPETDSVALYIFAILYIFLHCYNAYVNP